MADEKDQACCPGVRDAYRALAERMTSIHISRFSELPRIELYLDQLLSLVDDELSFMRLPDEGPLVTGSMVNNYVKRHAVPAPVKHRYTRRHICYVTCVCLFKRALSIEQVTRLIGYVEEENLDLAHTYDELCSALECALAEQFAVGPDFVAPAVSPRPDHRGRRGEPCRKDLRRAGPGPRRRGCRRGCERCPHDRRDSPLDLVTRRNNGKISLHYGLGRIRG